MTEELTLIGGNIVVNDGISCNANDRTYTVVTSDKNPAFVGDNVTFTASVYGQDIPEGTVQFFIDGAPVEDDPIILDSKGIARYSTSSLIAKVLMKLKHFTSVPMATETATVH